jgi:FMN reductase
VKVVGILGSPSTVSRSASLLQLAHAGLQSFASSYQLLSVRNLPAEAVLWGDARHPVVGEALAIVAGADVVLVATPIYKSAYSGLLKAFLDLLPSDALSGKVVLPLASGGTIAHLLALEYTLKPVLAALGARHILDPVFATDAQIPRHESFGYLPGPEVQDRIGTSLRPVIERAEELRVLADAGRQGRDLLARAQLFHQPQEAS